MLDDKGASTDLVRYPDVVIHYAIEDNMTGALDTVSIAFAF